MRFSSFSALAALANLCCAFNPVRNTDAPKIVAYDLFRTTRAAHASSDVLVAPVAEFLGGVSYNMNITIGTPPQNIAVGFDTGSSDLIVNSPSSPFCHNGTCIYGSFDQNASSSLKTINTKMGIVYISGFLTGRWATDTVHIAGATLPEFVLGVGDNSSTLPQNVLGVGFPGNIISGPRGNPTNKSTIAYMVEAGLVKSESFSVYLSGHSQTDGAVIFGGLDHAHYKGDLQTYPIVPNPEGLYDRLSFNVSSVSVDGKKTTSVMRTLIDTGAPDLRLPDAFIDSLWEAYNVTGMTIGYPELNMTWGLIDCKMANSHLTANVNVPGLEIKIPFEDLVIDPSPELIAGFGKKPSDIPEGQCLFNLNHGGGDQDAYILGIPFLQSTYAVFNLDTKEISLAPINRNPGPSNITEIAATAKTSPIIGSQTVPSATGSTTSSSRTSTPSPTQSTSAGLQLKSLPGPVMLGLLGAIALIHGGM